MQNVTPFPLGLSVLILVNWCRMRVVDIGNHFATFQITECVRGDLKRLENICQCLQSATELKYWQEPFCIRAQPMRGDVTM